MGSGTGLWRGRRAGLVTSRRLSTRRAGKSRSARITRRSTSSASNISTAICLGHRPHLGKGVPADIGKSIAKKGFQLVYGATINIFLNRRSNYLGYGPEAAELIGIPEPETFMQLPWDERVARLWCTLFRNREERGDPGDS